LTAEDRFALYLVATGTGFRANALANLTPGDFDLNAPTVTLSARFNKSRRLKAQPLPTDVVGAMRDHLTGKPSNAPVWGGTWATNCRGAEMLRIDLEAAGIAYTVEGPDGPEYADFHALRHSFLTLGGRSGIDLRKLQELAGHSDPILTARYSHRRLYDLAGAVDKLPNLVPTRANAEIPLRMTGTEQGEGRSAGRSDRGHPGASIGIVLQSSGSWSKSGRCG
jgi:integrase/recombinase XerC